MGEKKQKEKTTSFEVKGYHLKPLKLWLDIPMHREKAIARNKIVKLINEKLNEYEENRLLLVKEYAKKDAEGEAIMTEDGENYEMDDLKGFVEAFGVIKNAPVIFDLLPSNRNEWRTIRDIIKKTDIEMDVITTEFWEEVTSAMEKI